MNKNNIYFVSNIKFKSKLTKTNLKEDNKKLLCI